MARPDKEVVDLIQGLETLHKVMLGNTVLTGDQRFRVPNGSDRQRILRSSNSFIPQQDESFYVVLKDIVPALKQLQQGNPELAQEIIGKTGRIEAEKRRRANWAKGNQAHHVTEMIGQNMAVSQVPMGTALETLSEADKVVPMGSTPGRSLVSLTKQEHGPMAHFNREQLSPNAFGLSERLVARDVLSKNPQGVQEILELYLPMAQADMAQSLAPTQSAEGQALRNFNARLLGVTPEQLVSTEVDPNTRRGSVKTRAQSNLEALEELGVDVQAQGEEIYGDILEQQRRREAEKGIPQEERPSLQTDVIETEDGVQFTRNNLDRPRQHQRVPMTALSNPGDLTQEKVIYQIRPGELASLRRLGLRI